MILSMGWTLSANELPLKHSIPISQNAVNCKHDRKQRPPLTKENPLIDLELDKSISKFDLPIFTYQ